MPRQSKIKRPNSLRVGELYNKHRKHLGIKLVGSDIGFDRPIREPTINRPGLALAGFYTYFAYRRIQVIGNSERSYLNSLAPEQSNKRFEELCDREIPCIVVSRGKSLSADHLSIAESREISVFQTNMISMKFINAATIRLDWDFAPTTTEHGCMVDVQGVGVMVRGDSGTGKSECVLSLIERGASLVADDTVILRSIEGRELMGHSREIGRNHMEVRGLGIINVAAIFGVAAIRLEKRLDLVITLKSLESINDLERVGLRKQEYTVMGMKVPHIELLVAPGRDMAQLVEVAALDQKLKSFGHDAAIEFNKKLLKIMDEKTIS